ncbi:squalene--hopene cyclase [Melissospora conviva]|uniref:squalene--hopene cyclase n=1 Tax=Melissospora conviva TaxID=3388432 RepID=UPI003C1B944B
MTELLQPKPVGAPGGTATRPGQRPAPADAPRLTDDRLREVVERARDHLLGLQEPAGWWKGDLETNVTMDAEDLLLRQFLGIRTEEQTAATGRWIRSQQLADGAWPTFYGGPGDLSTTIEAYIGLRLAGDTPDAPHMTAAAAFVRAAGGIERSRVFTRFWLALFGLWPWHDLPAVPPELVLLPKWMPANVYDFACWARQTIVPLAVIRALRPVRDLGVDIDELRSGLKPLPAPRLRSRRGLLHRGDRLAAAYERFPLEPVRMNALRRCAEWIVARQEADGGWGGIQPPWVYSLMALHLLGYPMDHPVMKAGLDGLDGFTLHRDGPDGPVRLLEACQSPVWDTALAVVALSETGLPADDPAMTRAGQWLLGEEIRVKGDWAVRRPATPAGGWAFEFANDIYPDTDDTAEVMMALRRTAVPAQPAVLRATRWMLGMQSRDGGWAAFDADNTSEFLADLPFCDFGAVIDPPSADVTAHVVEALAHEGFSRTPAVRRGVGWLLAHQEPDGSWFGRWGANHVYGTGAVVPALAAAGVPASHPALQRAAQWLLTHQNSDGGWGEDLRSYREPEWIGRGASTASQTAWALLALHAVGLGDGPAANRGLAWLAATQQADGGWDEPYFTGTGFPRDFYINYGLYRLVFPVTALGRILTARTGAAAAAETAP